MKFFDRFYLDKEKDIIVNLYKENGLFYHKTVHFLSSLVNLFT